jgi:tRNA pseudouridine38-40 synthase
MTIQEVVETAVSKVLNEFACIYGCSRTDTGVHANEYCFSVKTNSTIKHQGFVRGVNSEISRITKQSDIAILSCEDVDNDFHARFSCIGKEYLYKIYNAEPSNPFETDLSFHYRRPLDIELLVKASSYCLGTHNFASFCGSPSEKSTAVRTIYELRIEKVGNNVCIYVKGDGFLYNMVRIIVGTLLSVNEKRFTPDDIPRIIVAADRQSAGRTAMAHGLYLNKVFYE